MKSNDIHIRAISQEMPQKSITKIHLKITYLKFHSNFPGANELKDADVGYGVASTNSLIVWCLTLYYLHPPSALESLEATSMDKEGILVIKHY